MMTTTKNRRGFTLMEVMACMIIISIVSSITLPAIDNFHSSDLVKADAQLLVSAIRHAKYTALQDNVLIRIIFNEDGSCFKEQLFTNEGDEENEGALSSTVEEIILNDYANILAEKDSSNYEYGYDWSTLGDTEETEFNSGTEVDISDFSGLGGTVGDVGGTLYFKPDGYIYASSQHKISEVRVIFKRGNAALAVDINALGVIASEAFSRNDDDTYEDEDIEW